MILVEVLTSIDMRILVVDSEPAETAVDDDLLQTAETAGDGVSTSLLLSPRRVFFRVYDNWNIWT